MLGTESQFCPSASRLSNLDQMLAAGGAFHALTLVLIKAPVVPGPDLTAAGLTIADYAGYANVVGVTWSAAFLDTDKSTVVLGADAPFICTAGTTPNTIYGYALLDVTLAHLQALFIFESPVGVNVAGDACPVIPVLHYHGD